MRNLSTRKILAPKPVYLTPSERAWTADYDAECTRLQDAGFHPKDGTRPDPTLRAQASACEHSATPAHQVGLG